MFNKVISFVKRNWQEILLHVFILALFMINARYVDYPDEYVNVWGAKTILGGGLPYRDFWDHHLPGAWYGGAILLFLAGGSFALFRIIWAFVVYAGLFALSRAIKKHYPDLHAPYMAFYILFPLAALYFWFHLFLADSLAVFFFAISFWILLGETFAEKRNIRMLIVSSLCVFGMVFSSATFLYMGVVMYLWHAYLLKFKPSPQMIRLVVWSAAPYVLYLLYVLVSGTWKEFYFANFTYNTNYYISIPNYVRGVHFNPVKFAMTLVANFHEGYLPLLSKIKHLDLYLPIGTLAGLATLVLFFLLVARNLVLGILFFLLLSFSAPRSNIQNYKETDYQSAMFILLGLISAVVALHLLRTIKTKEEWSGDLVRVARLVLCVFFIFTGIFLLFNSYNTAFKLYTQKLPLISNRGFTAEFVDEIIDPGESYFIGPYEPNQAFYVREGVWAAGRHPSLLPQFREGEELKSSFMKSIEANPPSIVIYRQETAVFGTPSLEFGKFFLDWMRDKYTLVEKIPNVEVLRSPTTFKLKADLYIRRDRLPDLLNKLEEKGYVSISSSPAILKK